MRILVDSAMPYWEAFFEPLGEVLSFSGGELNKDTSAQQNPHANELNDKLSTIDVLLVRSTTKVNASLLDKMPKVRFVGTATAGYDHLDTAELEQRNIKWIVAGGCNAQAVAQYVTSALLNLACSDKFLLQDKRVAIVGDGNVGSCVRNTLQAIGCDVMSYDPPLVEQINKQVDKQHKHVQFTDFDAVLGADIICLHAPLNSHAAYPSFHLFDEQKLKKLSSHQYLINAGRGEIIDGEALLQAYQRQPDCMPQVVLDVWENEPVINTQIIPFLRFASQHIAGHTLEGKANGTSMLYKALCTDYGIKPSVELLDLMPLYKLAIPPALQAKLDDTRISDATQIQNIVREVANCVYDIKNDDSVFSVLMAQSTSVGADFAQSRRKYPIRREFSALSISCMNIKIKEFLRAIGFIIS